MTQETQATLASASLKDILTELQRRGGVPGAVAEAQLLVLRKSQDYNGSAAAPDSERDAYFPLGAASYVQMIHVKSQRLVQLTRNDIDGRAPPNFEGVRDSVLDLINYAAFFAERLAREPRK